MSLSDNQLLKYSPHIMLPQVDMAGQMAICSSRILVLGVGGLGSAVALYLAAAGVGGLVLVDDDHVELSNLQRQIAHGQAAIGEPKVASAAARLAALNPDVKVTTVAQRLSESELTRYAEAVDVMVDCSDNFATRLQMNRVSLSAGKPLVSGAAIRFEGQLTVFDCRNAHSPCYQCLYDLTGEANLSCSESGVIGPLVGVMGSAQALETLKLVAGVGSPLVGRLQLFDAANFQWRELIIPRDPACPACAQRLSC